MSSYQFLAANSPMKDIKNDFIEMLTIKEAKDRGIKLPDWYRCDFAVGENKKVILHCKKEQAFRYIEISGIYDRQPFQIYSKKKYFSAITWEYSAQNARMLKEYITRHVGDYGELELWHVWLDHWKKPVVKPYHKNDLHLDSIEKFYHWDPFTAPLCFIIKK